jgi:hypothetical protein
MKKQAFKSALLMKAFMRWDHKTWFSLIFIVSFMTFSAYSPCFSGAQTATFSGKIVAVKLGPWLLPFVNRTATLVIEDFKGRQHTVHAGVKTSYFPHRTPELGDRVTVNCVKDEGLWAATTITYR